MADIYKMVNEFVVQRAKEMENSILGTIQEIAIENGIRTEVVLNERAITQAIVKSQKQKVIRETGLSAYYHQESCPSCRKEFSVNAAGYRYTDVVGKTNYCPYCGQALDWEA